MIRSDLRAEIVRVVGQGATHVSTRKGGYFESSVYVSGVWIVTVYGRENWKPVDRWIAKAPMHEEAALLAALQHFRVKYRQERPEIPVVVPDDVWAQTEPTV